MHKWEYKVIRRTRQIKLLKEVKWDIDVEELLPSLGEEGWELVSVSPVASDYNYHGFTTAETWVFKRPKE